MERFKRQLFEALWAATVEPGKVFRLITEPIAGRELPEKFNGHTVALDVGQTQPLPPRDMFVSEYGITCQLSFDGVWSTVFLPWACVGAMSRHDQSFMVCWGVRLPAEQPAPDPEPRRHLRAV